MPHKNFKIETLRFKDLRQVEKSQQIGLSFRKIYLLLFYSSEFVGNLRTLFRTRQLFYS